MSLHKESKRTSQMMLRRHEIQVLQDLVTEANEEYYHALNRLKHTAENGGKIPKKVLDRFATASVVRDKLQDELTTLRHAQTDQKRVHRKAINQRHQSPAYAAKRHAQKESHERRLAARVAAGLHVGVPVAQPAL